MIMCQRYYVIPNPIGSWLCTGVRWWGISICIRRFLSAFEMKVKTQSIRHLPRWRGWPKAGGGLKMAGPPSKVKWRSNTKLSGSQWHNSSYFDYLNLPLFLLVQKKRSKKKTPPSIYGQKAESHAHLQNIVLTTLAHHWPCRNRRKPVLTHSGLCLNGVKWHDEVDDQKSFNLPRWRGWPKAGGGLKMAGPPSKVILNSS